MNEVSEWKKRMRWNNEWVEAMRNSIRSTENEWGEYEQSKMQAYIQRKKTKNKLVTSE